VVICLERGADLHTAQLMPLPLTASCFSKIQIGFTFLVPAHPGSPGQRAVKRVCVCVSVPVCVSHFLAGTSAHTRGRSHSYKTRPRRGPISDERKTGIGFFQKAKSSPGYI